MRHAHWLRIGVSTLVLAGTAGVQAQTVVASRPIPIPVPTPGWETKASNPGNPNYHLPAYPIAFVRAPIVEHDVQMCQSAAGSCSTNLTNCTGTVVAAKDGDYHIGTDVLTANDPDPGNELWIFLPATGQVKKLFPRDIHETTGVIDFATEAGSVVEPNLSEDGTTIYFAYFQDATDAHSTQEYNSKLSLSGADLYALDIGPLLTAPSTNPDTLTVTRLTHRVYSAGVAYQQDAADRNRDAMNPTLAVATSFSKTEYGTVYMHPTEVRTRAGLYLAYVSDKRRLDNSNRSMNRQNHNFNLHLAPLLPDGTLGPEDNQFQYYTTTSALSPAPLRQGLSFSYQATTEDARMWHIQGLDSEGRWYPILGFGSNPELFHLATFCVADVGGQSKDYLVGTKYYNLNNEGFGSLWKQDLSVLGKNTYDNPVQNTWLVPRQVGSQELTDPPGYNISLSSDYPSDTNPAGAYWGKFTSPRCGGVNQLYFSYTPTSANGRLNDDQCSKSIYHAYVGYRPSLAPWTPGETVANNGHHIVIRRTNDDFNLMWPVPVVPWSVRSDGDPVQQTSSSSAISAGPYVAPGEPFAVVGTSALYNTDRRPFECYFKQNASGAPKYYSPWGVNNVNQEHDLIGANQDGWTYVNSGPGNDFCVAPPPSQILGIAVNLTSNKANYQDSSFDYTPELEAVRLLGVYDVRSQTDQSFLALIPAHVPFELQALDSTYGMKLTDVRSWHSLKPREMRADCGGCHQHDVNGSAVPFAGTYASTQPPLDLVRATPSIGYDAHCNVQAEPPNTLPARDYPEWRAEIWPQMNAFCGSCHNSSTGNGTGNAALAWAGTSTAQGDQVYDAIVNRRFASSQRGAIGSQLFWAARGQRTDNRSNTAYPANYGCTSCSNAARWGFYYTAAHNALASNCTNALAGYAAWLFKLGKWIDNHMPRDTGTEYPYDFDWYHPTADSALISANCAPTLLRVGWWDDSDQLKSIRVLLNDDASAPLYVQQWPSPAQPFPNGTASVPLPAVASSDWITVEVRDHEDNRQIYRKRVAQLIDECDPSPPMVGDPVTHPVGPH